MFEGTTKNTYMQIKHRLFAKKIDFYLNTLAIPLPLRYHLEGYA